jgi:hypothetical protein
MKQITKKLGVAKKAASLGERMIFVRLPPALRERFAHQEKRFSCSANMLARMGIIQFLERAEAEEKANEDIRKGR